MLRGTHQVGAAVALFGLGALLARPMWVVPVPFTDRELVVDGVSAALAEAPQRLGLGLGPVSPPLGATAALAVLVAAVAAATVPDLDRPRALWARLAFLPLTHGHRHLWHSLLGLALWAGLLALALPPLLRLAGGVPGLTGAAADLLRASGAIWLAAVAGYVSHLVLDTLTIEGVPWLYPLPWRLGLPLVARWRLRTGGLREQWLVVPALLVLAGLLWYGSGATLLRWVG